MGMEPLLEAIVSKISPPQGDPKGKFKALIFDSLFNVYKGAVVYIRVIDGVLNTGRPCTAYGERRRRPKPRKSGFFG